jgi:hypothetical protein
MAQGTYELVEQGGLVRDQDGRTVVDQAKGTTVAIASGTAANTVVKATPGVLLLVLVTTTNTNPMNIFDNASTNAGTVIGALPASPTVGTVFAFQMPAANGITVGGSGTNPGVTISFI